MSGLVTLTLAVIGCFGSPSGPKKHVAWICWAAVMLGLTLALLVDAKGWP